MTATTDVTYYGRPMLKESVWGLDIPLYYFCGGAAGAAMTLGAAMQLAARGGRNRRQLRELSKRCHWTGILGSTMGAALLVHDLGRPSRFAYMLRVFRPTSPMNLGAWILAGAAPSAIATGLFINRRGVVGKLGEVSGFVSGIFGAALAGYTGVLVSNTVLPVWQQSGRWIPVMFIGSAAASAASILDIFSEDEAARRVTQVYGTAGRIVELAAAKQVERLASTVPQVGEPFRKGAPAALWKAAGALTAASLVVSLLPLNAKKKRRIAGVLGAAGSLCLRLAVHYLGNASARDPRAAIRQQRKSLEAAYLPAERTGSV